MTHPSATPAQQSGHAGLSSQEAQQRLAKIGSNELVRESTTPAWKLLLGQFNSPVIWLLFGACLVSAALGEVIDAIAIGTIVIVNALVGFFQEYRAEKAVLALRSMTAPRARVMRDGHLQVIPAALVVPGDILVLEAGDIVAADAHLLEANVLSTLEAALTGESTPVGKSTKASAPNAPLAERCDHVFSGTNIATGTGVAQVTATGMQTELGHIAHLLSTAKDESTPLQQRLAALSQRLMLICLGIVVAVALLGWKQGLGGMEVLLSAISLAVAAVPEGLPAIVTIALAVGMQRMAARHALLRRLTAVETLGCATVICTDKTGTLTTGVMTVREIWGVDQRQVLDAATACCDADLSEDERSGVGDPTEVAIVVAAAQRGIKREQIEAVRARVSIYPFDADRKRMSIFRSDGVLYAKGSLESLAGQASLIPAGMMESAAEMAGRGLRVLCVAVGREDRESGLELIGLLGIADPPRTEAVEAIARASAAGIRTVMITGDHQLTAQSIARELGMLKPGEDPGETVHARATPEDKLRIVREWKSRGAIVAMTGDGVNDAPALREAHIGIAMGQTGTEVTREAADIVLADDNFATIVAAVEEGRSIFENIRKAIAYLLAGNVAELSVVFIAAVMGYPPILLPLQLLWINLVTDGVPALALVTDRSSSSIMNRPPRPASDPLIGAREWRGIFFAGALQAILVMAVFIWALEARSLEEARNLAFSVLVFGELLRAFSARDPDRPFWEIGLFSNMKLFLIVVLSVMLQLGLHHIPATQKLFSIGAISLADCGLSLAIGFMPLVVLEMGKVCRRWWLTKAHGFPAAPSQPGQ
ncbi:cation-translocating P-type ATPase [Aquabacterium sp.]|uniref:cation-translocating P-type ATPase n=1 Tax=Aquabacterium sp. TaxID=1872578 RepID=UPI0040377E65